MTSTVRLALTCAVLVAMHFTVRPLLGWRTGIDFLLIALVFGSVRMRPGAAAVFGLLLGLATDSLALGSFGAGALAATLVGYGSSRLKAVFLDDNIALNALFLLAGKWVFDLVFIVVARQMQGLEMVVQLVLWSPVAAAVTAIAGVALLAVLRPLHQARAA